MQNADQPFFSIIIPTYNRAERLRLAIESVLAQTYKSYEVIVVDDGSNDNTSELVVELSKQKPSIKYFYKQNEERSIARNFGIFKSSGKYINFLDSDDLLYSNHFAVAHQLLTNNNMPEVGHLGYELIDATGKTLLVRDNFDKSYSKKLIHENIIHGNAIFVRRDIAINIHFIPSSFAIVSEDWYLWLKLAARYQFYFDNTVTSAIVHHSERSLLNVNPEKLIRSTETIVTFLKKDAPFMQKYGKLASYHFANHYTYLTLILALSKSKRWRTVKYLIMAMRYDPSVIFRRRFAASVKHLF